MEFILHLLLILFFAKVLGEVIEHMGFSSILGELLAGIFLGILVISPDNEILSSFADLGACLLYTSDAADILTCRSRWSPYH